MKVIITGATGMVGEGVLLKCLQDPQVESVLALTRRPTGIHHPKLQEVIHKDFYDIFPVAHKLSGYDACFFCLGVSSVGMKADAYYKSTYTLTMHVAETLSKVNSGMTFCYVSGAGTDSTEKGGLRWARVKGKTENDLGKLPFRHVYNFRPGFIKPLAGQRYAHPFYKYINWVFPIGRALYAKGFCTLDELGQAMINVVSKGYKTHTIEGTDIIALAKA